MKAIGLALLLTCANIAAAQTTAPAVWQMQESGSTASLRGIFSVDGSVVWASGPGEKSRLYKTVDGCGTWALVFKNPDKDGFWDAISTADKKNFMILGDPVGGQFSIFDTTDGGKTWDKTQDKGLQNQVKEGAFAASNSSLLANWVDGIAAFGGGSPFGARLFRECGRCKRNEMWSASTIPSFPKGEAAGIFSMDYRNWRCWVAVGGDYTKPNQSVGTAAWSADGGEHWTASATPPHGFRSAVRWSEALRVWIAVGTNGSDISRDDGKNWQVLDDGNWNALALPFVVGPKGRIARLNAAALAGK
jgi:photosystem II stability/assembly factor-like uncharacterized protein